jgi:carotenoid 1,2-hydratase
VRGKVTLRPECVTGAALDLDAYARHGWWPVAPLARIEVDLDRPRVRFRGHGYHDANWGAEPLEAGFERWTWSRSRIGAEARIAYDVEPRHGGSGEPVGLRVDTMGRVQRVEPGPLVTLPRTGWGLRRGARAEAASLARSLEDGPFYARALVHARVAGRDALAVHEVLEGARLRRRWVRFLTGFRMRSEAA